LAINTSLVTLKTLKWIKGELSENLSFISY
jgi:hypothetical protein